MRKGPGYIARSWRTGRKSFLEAADLLRAANEYKIRTPQPAMKMGAYTLKPLDYAKTEQRWTFPIVDAAAQYLATVSQDPRNHFGKHALRRFDK